MHVFRFALCPQEKGVQNSQKGEGRYFKLGASWVPVGARVTKTFDDDQEQVRV